MSEPINEICFIASDGYYSDGYYIGYANQVTFNSGIQAQGIYPDTDVAPENLNNIFYNHAEWSSYINNYNNSYGQRGTIVAFETPGTYDWTIPESARYLKITVVGGGGDGGATVGTDTGATGGGSSGGWGTIIIPRSYCSDVLSIKVGSKLDFSNVTLFVDDGYIVTRSFQAMAGARSSGVQGKGGSAGGTYYFDFDPGLWDNDNGQNSKLYSSLHDNQDQYYSGSGLPALTGGKGANLKYDYFNYSQIGGAGGAGGGMSSSPSEVADGGDGGSNENIFNAISSLTYFTSKPVNGGGGGGGGGETSSDAGGAGGNGGGVNGGIGAPGGIKSGIVYGGRGLGWGAGGGGESSGNYTDAACAGGGGGAGGFTGWPCPEDQPDDQLPGTASSKSWGKSGLVLIEYW